MSKFLFYGVGSYKNRGCEALVNSTINQFPTEEDIVIASYDLANNKKYYNDRAKYVNHYSDDEKTFSEADKKKLETIRALNNREKLELFYQRDLIKELEKCDIAVHLGGDNYCYHYNYWMYAIVNKAYELNKKNVLWGASLFDDMDDDELINDLKKYDLIMLREQTSYNAIKKYIEEDKLMLVRDPAFSLKPKDVKLDKWYDGKKVLGLNLSPLTIKEQKDFSALIDFVKYILENTDYAISMIPHVTIDNNNDLDILNKIKDNFKDDERIFVESDKWNCEEIKYIISQMKFMVVARTHASIAAYSSCVPTLVIGYSVKSRGIAEDLFGSYLNYVVPLEELSGNNLINKFNYINDRYDETKEILVKKMKTFIPEASDLYNRMLERLNLLEKKNICKKNLCSGCTACLNVCPVNAISMKENMEGFKYPEIDDKKCINCGKCRKTCPVLNKSLQKHKRECYVAYSKNEDILKKSSSGGIFYLVAKYVIQNSGIVYGASKSFGTIKHIRVDSLDDLDSILGSKYAQSELDTIFKSVKEDLNSGKQVLFSGVPCQINGLKKYLNKEYNNLILVSVICHGIINSKLVDKRIKEFNEKFDCNVRNVSFKNKKNGWAISSISYESDKNEKLYKFNDDDMMYLFVNNYALRDSCYECSSKSDYNLADIILGDYWGVINEHPDMFNNNGTSAIIINTDTGKKLFSVIKNDIEFASTDYAKISKYNSALINSVEKPLYRERIFNDLINNNLELIVKLLKTTNQVNNKSEEERLSNRVEELASENRRLFDELQSSNYTRDNLNNELHKVVNSKRFKVGSIVLKPLDIARKIKNRIKK